MVSLRIVLPLALALAAFLLAVAWPAGAADQKGDGRVLKRAIDVIYLTYLEKQVDPELLKKMTALSNSVEKKFSTFRAKVDGKEMTDAEVRKVLKTSRNSERLQAVYEASKDVGKLVE